MKYFSNACEENKYHILEIIKPLFKKANFVLEIGSGTGQHAAFFSSELTHLTWQASDKKENLASIQEWGKEIKHLNTTQAIELDVNQTIWPRFEITDAIFSANTAHIMDWESVVNLFNGVNKLLSPGSIFVLYGPFNYQGNFTGDSNRAFDSWLKEKDPQSGIKDFEELIILAERLSLRFKDDIEMPANNRILVWEKI